MVHSLPCESSESVLAFLLCSKMFQSHTSHTKRIVARAVVSRPFTNALVTKFAKYVSGKMTARMTTMQLRFAVDQTAR